MSVEENKALVLRAFAEFLNTGDTTLVDQYVAPEFVRHALDGGPDVQSPEGVKMFVGALRAAFPDLEMVIEDIVAEDDKVVVRYTARGTHKGGFRGAAPTGNQVTWAGINIYREEGGQVMETWQLGDRLGMMQQMGLVPPMGRTET